MQVAANRADHVVHRHLFSFLAQRVQGRLVEDRELDRIDLQIRAEIDRLVGELARQCLVASNRRQIVGIRELVVVKGSGECALVALERTLLQAIVAYEVVGLERQVEEVVRTNGLIDWDAQVEAGHTHRQVVVVAAAQLGGEHLSAEEDARGARVRVVGSDHLLEQIGVVERRADQLVVFVHTTLAVGVGPLVELRVERAVDAYLDAEARIEQSGRRRQVERVVGRVLDENVHAAQWLHADQASVVPVVGQTGVNREREFEQRARARVDSDQIDRRVVRVETSVEAIATVEPRQPDPLKVARVALPIADCAAYDGQVAEQPLLAVVHVVACFVVDVALELLYAVWGTSDRRWVQLREQIGRIVARHGELLANGDSRKYDAILGMFARGCWDLFFNDLYLIDSLMIVNFNFYLQ